MYSWDFTVVWNNFGVFVQGMLVSLKVTAAAIVIGTALGLMIAIGRHAGHWGLRIVAGAYSDIVRSIPVLVVMIWIYFCLPGVGATLLGGPIRVSPDWAAIAALSMYLAAMLADVFFSGIRSVPQGQLDVARTLGLSWFDTQRFIVLPQAVRLVLPPVLGQYVSTLLLSSLASVIAVQELLHRAQDLIANRFHSLEIYTLVAACYLAVALPLTMLTKRLTAQTWRKTPKEWVNLDEESIEQGHFEGAEIRAIDVSYKVANHAIIEGLTFDVEPGQTLAVIGPSGAGKSTLLRMIAGLIKPAAGALSICGATQRLHSPGIGYVPQDCSLWPHMTALDNVALPLQRVLGNGKKQSLRHGATWLRRFGLADRLGAFPGTLSGGEVQRVAIARALALNPSVLLLDEITASLDPERVGDVISVIQAIAHQGVTLVLVGHHLDSVFEISDRVLFLKDGKQRDYGETAAVFQGRCPDVARFLQKHVLWSHRRDAQTTHPPDRHASAQSD